MFTTLIGIRNLIWLVVLMMRSLLIFVLLLLATRNHSLEKFVEQNSLLHLQLIKHESFLIAWLKRGTLYAQLRLEGQADGCLHVFAVELGQVLGQLMHGLCSVSLGFSAFQIAAKLMLDCTLGQLVAVDIVYLDHLEAPMLSHLVHLTVLVH